MFNMFNAFFAFFTKLFSAAEKTASALDILAGIAETTASTYADEVANKRATQAIQLAKELQAAGGSTSTRVKAALPAAVVN